METDTVTNAEEQKTELEVCPLPSGLKEDENFYFPDGNLYIRVNTHEFFVHKYKLGEFRDIESQLAFQTSSHQVLQLEGDENDFRNAFRVLYASFYSSDLSNFDVSIMVSTLRIATKFNHSPLRKFAIDNLELKQLPPMEYLPLAKEFNVPEWEARAIDHLAIRDEPVTVAEANLLDTESFVAMLHRREQQLRRPQKASEQPATNNAAQTTDNSRETTEDVIDLCDAPEDQLDKPTMSESPDSDSSLSSPPRYPRRKSTIQQTPATKAGKTATQSVRQNGVSKRGRRRKQ